MKNSFKLALLALSFAGSAQSATLAAFLGKNAVRGMGVVSMANVGADLLHRKECGCSDDRLTNNLAIGGGLGLAFNILASAAGPKIATAATVGGKILEVSAHVFKQGLALSSGFGLSTLATNVARKDAEGKTPFAYNPWVNASEKNQE